MIARIAGDQPIEMLEVDAIIVPPDRRRQEVGDIRELADSIALVGLMHPLIVDERDLLVAGLRRLCAVKSLTWARVPVRRYAGMTFDERLLVELEENLRRLDLTPQERSRSIVQAAETAARVERREQTAAATEFRTDPGQKAVRGRPTEAGSDRAVAERTGIPPATIQAARSHLRAVRDFPETAELPQSTAIEYARAVIREPALRRSGRPLEEIAREGREARLAQRAAERAGRHIGDPARPATTEEEQGVESFLRARYQTDTNLLVQDPARAVELLDADQLQTTRWFAERLRDWMTALIAALAARDREAQS